MFQHERVIISTGARSGLPVILALHSTALGQALGGCRLKHYGRWEDGLADALRLSAAMSDKCAAAGLPNGGGKTVVVLPPGDPSLVRRAALLDVGDAIEALRGRYATGPDVGTGPADMDTIAERTRHVFCRPVEHGGSGDSSGHTADGIVAALRALPSGRSFAVVGLGNVGADVARQLRAADPHATLVVADVDASKRALATELGAAWMSPDEALRAEVDVLVPAALGGILTPATVPQLRCGAICGPANNQLDAPPTATLLHERGILWVPDFVASAGGVVYATAVEVLGEEAEVAAKRVAAIGDTVRGLLATGRPLHEAAIDLARSRIKG
jgi:glutamate dehydrogenase/leucine dehydrogenase